ncbi:PREDICTED: uncharacterized protein LOC106106077, partial [Papilio polytes]|uniref:uncharacterized protein LOC106106077 n=1 Tax=Papilio polytes TaxID=76194 RepID=UPI000675D331
METDYDRKFEEMKKYIPFLENMIGRLESAGTGSGNPRRAQLAKIRSLRDLLLDKRKRMKMENLMKCEQVLVNLYAKIEQRDSFLESSDIGNQNPQLDLVRSKLQKVATRLQIPESLPDIVGPTGSDEVTSGSKEPALFQIRKNKALSPARSKLADSEKNSSSSILHKKNYTRVLVSPNRETKPLPTDISKTGSPIRTSKKSPRKTTSYQNKKDRKKSSSQSQQTTQLKDLNITLKVPEESLNSLNTKDILSRIINCSDNDVDIDTLRGLRTQILSELKQTGAKDDISDLILESYKRKKKSSSKKKKKEFEEGELSDSESEIIESIYGSLVVVDKDQGTTSNINKVDEKDELPRKIQICLVINSEKESQNETITTSELSKKKPIVDLSDFEFYEKNETNMKPTETDTEKKETTKQFKDNSENTSSKPEINEKPDGDNEKCDKTPDLPIDNNSSNEKIENSNSISNTDSPLSEILPTDSKLNSTIVSLNEDSSSKNLQPISNRSSTMALNEKSNETISTETQPHENIMKPEDSIEIPLLDLEANAKKEVVQEIDILQALKKEILSEKISLSDSETNTPPLHQPKVTKVANIEKILPKKRISIEKYKEKSTSAPQPSLFISESNNNTSKDDLLKKQSLKLTEKEYERFNLSTNVSLAETSDEEDKEEICPPTDIYSGLAPKSPDHEDFADTGIKPPIIIPAEPVKAEVVPSKSDVDMRMMPLKPQSKLSTDNNKLMEKPLEGSKKETELSTMENLLPLTDPRVRRDISNLNIDSAMISTIEHVSRTQTNFPPNMTPTRMPKTALMSGINQTKVIPNMVHNLPSTTMGYEMTPSRVSLDGEHSKLDHVYAPTFPVHEPSNISGIDGQNSGIFSRTNLGLNQNDIQNTFYVENSFISSECPSTPNHSFGRLDMPMTPIHTFGRAEGPMTPSHPFGRTDCSPTPSYPFGRNDCPSTPSYLYPRADGSSTPSHSYGRIDCPSTPSHPFGRSDCPPTPSHSFGRSDCPPTPSHSFGRSDCPPTPSHSFGRSDCPPTPSHSFGRSDCPPTPSHSFGRSDCPPTPSHSFGRSDCPPTPSHSFGRSDCPPTPSHPFGRTDYSPTPSRPFGRKEHLMTPNHSFSRGDFSQNQSILQNSGDRYNNFQNARSNRYSENDNLRYYSEDIDSRKYNERKFNTHNQNYEESRRSYNDSYRNYDRHVSRRETSTGRSSYKNYKYDRRCSKDRSTAYGARDCRYEADSSKSYDSREPRRNDQREHSVGCNLSDAKYSKSHKEKDYATGNTLSVQSNTGRSFTIDTSVNRSFQETASKFKNESKTSTNFDARRIRASSVGRHLVRESSAEKKLNNEKTTNSPDLKTNFRRACSVGRESAESHSRKRFEDIKEELQSYKHTDTKNNKSTLPSSQGTVTDKRKKLNDRDPRLSRRDCQDLENCKKEDQSTKVSLHRGDIRDPRLQRGLTRDTQNKLHEGKSIDECKKQGIVYSNDNIARGTILGTGYGVKNYKIPKIKKPQVETCAKVVVDDTKVETEKKSEIKKQNNTNETNTLKFVENKERCDGDSMSVSNEKVLSKSENKDNIQENDKNESVIENVSVSVEKRVTRSSTKSSGSEILKVLNSDNKPVSRKTRNRIKKPLQYDSDSDDNVLVIDTQVSKECTVEEAIEKDSATLDDKVTDVWDSRKPTDNPGNSKGTACDSKLDESEGTKHSESLISAEDLSTYIPDSDNCFGMDLEMFSDSLATDPVIENINELIADLDDDLETSKNDGNKRQFTKEIILENMLENITCAEKTACENSSNDSEKVTEINEFINKTNDNSIPNVEINIKQQVDSNSGEVSTTETEIKCTLPQKKLSTCYDVDDDICSTPDSTINVNENVQESTCQEKLPDSTGVEPCEMSSDITSTEAKDTDQLNSSHSDTINQSDSIGSLLSILKDKSKIQELLTMIKDQSNGNEKLKRKLEMLSEIVSDDEDLSNSSKSLSSTTDNNNEKTIVEATAKSNDAISDYEDIKDKTLEMSTDAMLHRSVEIDSTTETDHAPGPSTISDTENKDNDEKVNENVENVENREAFQERIENKDVTVESDFFNNNEKTKIENKKPSKRIKGRANNSKVKAQKPPTRSSAHLKIDKPPSTKKPSRELKQLQNDIKEMFLNEDVLNSSGIRMCRLAKLVEDKSSPDKIEIKNDQNVENTPDVTLQKTKQSSEETTPKGKACKKKQTLKTKGPPKQSPLNKEKNEEITESNLSAKCKPGPKSKTKVLERTDVDPYMFESDSIAESNDTNGSEKQVGSGSESDCDSLVSSQSFGSNEHLVEVKKKMKRRRGRGWQSGVFKPKNKKKKIEPNLSELKNASEFSAQSFLNATDDTCFTDKTYCFSKNVMNYSCRLCPYTGTDIIHHHKKQHPHSEIPLSRLSPEIAKEAIEQSEEFNFQIISQLPIDKYVCRFCFEEFSNKKKTVLESFFWHVVSTHTGEYKQPCSECENVKQCPFNLDIPPPPKEPKGQLIGYICGKCNFTQISLENLKTHVINRHNNEDTEVYTINLGVMSKRTLSLLTKPTTGSEPRKLRSSRGGQTLVEASVEPKKEMETAKAQTETLIEKLDIQSDTKLDKTQKNKRKQMKSQIYFENEDVTKEICELSKVANIKVEPEQDNDIDHDTELCESQDDPSDTKGQQPLTDEVDTRTQELLVHKVVVNDQQDVDVDEADSDEKQKLEDDVDTYEQELLADDVDTDDGREHEALADDVVPSSAASNDVLDYPHFKVNYKNAGSKEYVCCINGAESHYRTALLISFKKHVQLKHTEIWDGFCFLCKLIVTPQGKHFFKDCLQHFLDKHIDNFPIMENEENPSNTIDANTVSQTVKVSEQNLNKNSLNVRPLSELIGPAETPPQTTL